MERLEWKALGLAAKALGVSRAELTGITMLKRGMTNRSWLISCRGKRYILRVPGEGTDQLADRKGEAAVYQSLRGTGFGDHLIFLDPVTGCKLTEYWENARACDPMRQEDVRACMRRLRAFHNLNLTVEHIFDLFGQIEFYERLRGNTSIYEDYAETKGHVLNLRAWLERHERPLVLTHIDAVPDNFLFLPGEEEPRLAALKEAPVCSRKKKSAPCWCPWFWNRSSPGLWAWRTPSWSPMSARRPSPACRWWTRSICWFSISSPP